MTSQKKLIGVVVLLFWETLNCAVFDVTNRNRNGMRVDQNSS